MQAIKQKKLFMIDYHDLLLPYVKKVRQIKGTSLYGSRALFFLTPIGTLKPVAIELVRSPMNGKPQWKKAYSPGFDATSVWLGSSLKLIYWHMTLVFISLLVTGIFTKISAYFKTLQYWCLIVSVLK